MRVIQTTVYFDPRTINGLATNRNIRENPGVTFLCFPGMVTGEFELRQEADFGLAERPEGKVWRTSNDLSEPRLKRTYGDLFLDAALRGKRLRETMAERFAFRITILENAAVVRDLLHTDVVIEESPPRWEKFGRLLEKAPDVVIGTYVGMEAARDHPTLMIFSVGASIIVVGSAMAVSKALQRGLNKRIGQVFRSRSRGQGRLR